MLKDKNHAISARLGTVLALLILAPAVAYGQGVLFVENDNVGVGTATPSRPLDVDATGAAQSNVMRLLRDGAVRYRLENSDIGVAWDVTNTGTGLFSFQLVGLAQNLLSINPDGNLAIGCNVANHDLMISPGPSCLATPHSYMDAGDTSFTTSSSLTLKENLSPVELSDILDKMSDVKVYTYDFIDGPENRLGLVAEEFHQIFNRGSDKVLNGQEVQMALWLGVQALSKENADLHSENRDLKERLERLEQIVLGQEHLGSEGSSSSSNGR